MTRHSILLTTTFLFALSTGCSTCGEAIDVIAPCDVVLSQNEQLAHKPNPQGVEAFERGEYWRPGPYYTWNSAPDEQCRDHPRATTDSEAPNTALMVTYPTKQNPLTSGFSDIADGPWPVIVFSHANNDTVCSIFERYNTLHQHWASWGYIVISVDDTAFNCMRGNRQNIVDRSTAQLAAWTSIEAWNDDPQSIFYQRVSPKVIFAGHSRGGGGSIVSWQTLTQQGGQVEGIIDLQGIDVTSFGFGKPDINVPFMGISASKDVDLDYPYVEPTEEQLKAPYTWLTIYGGIHAYTADTVPIEPDDEPAISQRQQHQITNYYTTAFLRHTIGIGDGQPSPKHQPTPTPDILFGHEGAKRIKRSISELGVAVRWNSYGTDDLLIDNFNGPKGDNNPDLNELGGANTATGFTRNEEVPTYQPDTTQPSSMYSKAYSRLLVATEQTGTLSMSLGEQPKLFAAGTSFQARVKGPDKGAMPQFKIIFRTTDGDIERDGANHIGPQSITNRFVQLVIDLNQAGLVNKQITAVDVQLSSGSLFLDDPRFVVSP